MTTYVQVASGFVVNRTLFDGDMPDGWADENDTWIASDEAQIGWSYDGSIFSPPPLPEPEKPTPVVLTSISKDAIWRRATDEEAEQMEAALQAQPVRLRRIYEGATFISAEDELYGVLAATLVQLFGAERADELLEPTG